MSALGQAKVGERIYVLEVGGMNSEGRSELAESCHFLRRPNVFQPIFRGVQFDV